MTDRANGIATVLSAVFDGLTADGRQILESLKDDPLIQEAREAVKEDAPEDFFFTAPYRFQQVIDAIVEAEYPGSPQLQFLMASSEFVSSHLDALFTKFEGSPCSHDKTCTVMRALMLHYKSGEPIKFQYSPKTSFGYPKKILKSHEAIIQYFNGLHHLYHGNPDHYLVAMNAIVAEHAASTAPAPAADENAPTRG